MNVVTVAYVAVLRDVGATVADHAPTARSQEQTYTIAQRLHRGEHLYEDA